MYAPLLRGAIPSTGDSRSSETGARPFSHGLSAPCLLEVGARQSTTRSARATGLAANCQWALGSFVRNLFFGGSYTPDPPSVSMLYTDPDRIVQLLAETSPYQLVRLNY